MKRRQPELPISEKAGQILKGILVVLFILSIRLWYLCVICHSAKLEEAQKPQRRIVIERAERATICDRFGISLATNRATYEAGICYAQMRRIPRVSWKKENGCKVKCYERKEYIKRLSTLLGNTLFLDPDRIEDIIYSKAAILGMAPYVLKENISEETYFRLKMLEKDWPGVYTNVAARRTYPNGAVLGEVVGHIGPISRSEYDLAMAELKQLKERAEEEGIDLSHEIEKKSFTFNDFTGKVGVEASFDARLRGSHGKRVYLADTRGHLLRELNESEPSQPGEKLTLSISSQLQAYAEQLLTEYSGKDESQRSAWVKRAQLIPERRPWIKEGAIVVMDPNNGQLLALASYPRYDPNDFIRNQEPEFERIRNFRVGRWLETEDYLGAIWDRQIPLAREKFNVKKGTFYEESLEIGWNEYLSFILPKSSTVRTVIEKKNQIQDAIDVQRSIDYLLFIFEAENVSITVAKILDAIYSEEDVPTKVMISLSEWEHLKQRISFFQEEIALIKQRLAPYFDTIPLNEEKLLLVDLYRLCIDPMLFNSCFEGLVGEQTLHEYREISGRVAAMHSVVRDIVQQIFKDHEFKEWRECKFKRFLAQKRKEERFAKKRYARPYLDFLDEVEHKMFEEFWAKNRLVLLSIFLAGEPKSYFSSGLGIDSPYATVLLGWKKELEQGAHLALSWYKDYCHLQELVSQFDASILPDYFKTLRSFKDLGRPLYGNYPSLRQGDGMRLEKHLACGFYPRYGFGYARSHAFRQATTLASIFKLVPAYEALRQNYFRSDQKHDLNPLVIIDDKYRHATKGWYVGKTNGGKEIPLYYKGGRLPRSEHAGIGRVDLVKALEASSNPYFALLSGDFFDDPEDICAATSLFGFGEKSQVDLPGEYAGFIPNDVAYNRTGLYSMSIGQHTLLGTPLQAAVMLASIANGGAVYKPQIILNEKPEVRWNLFMPKEIQKPLLDGMRAVVMGEKGTARFLRSQFPSSLVNRTIGKTGTGEVIDCYGLDVTSRALKSKVIWFISVINDEKNQPELVIIIYLRDGEFGRLAAPLALKMAQKWHEICVNMTSKRIEETSHGEFTSS